MQLSCIVLYMRPLQCRILTPQQTPLGVPREIMMTKKNEHQKGSPIYLTSAKSHLITTIYERLALKLHCPMWRQLSWVKQVPHPPSDPGGSASKYSRSSIYLHMVQSIVYKIDYHNIDVCKLAINMATGALCARIRGDSNGTQQKCRSEWRIIFHISITLDQSVRLSCEETVADILA